MKTVSGVVALVQEYACDYHDSYHSKLTGERLKALRIVLEELAADAAKWREYKAREDVGMGINPLRTEAK